VVKGMPVLRFPPKPVLTGPFIPYKAPKRHDHQATGPGGEHSPTNQLEPWRSWNENPEGNRDPGSPADPSRRTESTWEPPLPEAPRYTPPREEAPRYQPLPAASAPAPAPASAPAAPVAAPPTAPLAPPPISPPPPVSAPPPLP